MQNEHVLDLGLVELEDLDAPERDWGHFMAGAAFGLAVVGLGAAVALT